MVVKPPSASVLGSSAASGPSRDEQLIWFRQFRSHFIDWVFGPIGRLVRSDDALVGFIMMACAIDYLAGFWWGKTTERQVRDAYTGFINSYFPQARYDAEGLYESLRNGLVHMFTIKGKKYALTHNHPEIHLRLDVQGQIVLNASDFRNDLEAAMQAYFNEVESSTALLDKAFKRFSRDGFLNAAPLSLA